MSVSVRFGLSDRILNIFKTLNGLHPTVEFQHMAAEWIDQHQTSAGAVAASDEILATYAECKGSPLERFWCVQRRLEEMCARDCPEKVAIVLDTGPIDRAYVERAVLDTRQSPSPSPAR